MRIWDLPPNVLCRQHLLGEHRELHAIWTIITQNKKSPYSHHPETKRWIGKLNALYQRHQELVKEMENRGYNHKSPLNQELATGQSKQDVMVNTVPEQIERIKTKRCKYQIELI